MSGSILALFRPCVPPLGESAGISECESDFLSVCFNFNLEVIYCVFHTEFWVNSRGIRSGSAHPNTQQRTLGGCPCTVCSHMSEIPPAGLRGVVAPKSAVLVCPDLSQSHQSGETRTQSRRGEEFESSSAVGLDDETHVLPS